MPTTSGIKIVFFASCREAIGIQTMEFIPSYAPLPVRELIEQLIVRLGDRGAALENPRLLLAINHGMADREDAVTFGDEVAFFPPVTGG